jgi:hypothetical protein
MIEQHEVPAHAVTAGQHHFFGYYDKFPWDRSGRYLLGLEATFMERQPTPEDVVTIGLIDLEDGNRWQPLDQTYAWCWQQGTMLQWLPSAPDSKIIYNQRQDNQFVSIIRDVYTGETRTLPRPIYCVSPDGRQALSINFARLNRTRPGYGYVGVADPGANDPFPADDGIFWIDLETGENRLIISYADMRHFNPVESMNSGQHWFNHLTFAPDSSRFVFLHRWQHDFQPGRKWIDRLVSARPDGSGPCLVANDHFVSHYDYFDPQHVLAWSYQENRGMHYFMYTDCADEVTILGEDVFETDGHCSFSPDRQWMLTDTYPDAEHRRALMLYHMATGQRIDIGRFYAPPELTGPVRCDLHPRWSRDGRQVCIDSAHEGTRQIYVLDVAEIIDSR